jgi:hypothetical protein
MQESPCSVVVEGSKVSCRLEHLLKADRDLRSVHRHVDEAFAPTVDMLARTRKSREFIIFLSKVIVREINLAYINACDQTSPQKIVYH